MKKVINSIEELLRYFKNSNTYVFTLGPLNGPNLLNINDFIPNFEIITCGDPYLGGHPFITVPKSIKPDHVCQLGTSCAISLLSNPEVIAYIKSKDPNPSLVLLLIDEKIEELCRANGINMWFPSVAASEYLGNKINILDELNKADIPYIPNICSKIYSYAHFQEVSKPFGEKIVVQAQNGVGGWGTMKIHNQDDYRLYQQILENGEVFKIMPMKNVKAFAIDVVATKSGTFVGPLLAELIGCDLLTLYPQGYCGNQLRSKYFQDEKLDKEIRAKIIELSERLTNHIYETKLFRGTFGLDFCVDLDTDEIYLMEVNARMTGPNAISFELYHAQGHSFPLLLYHCAEYLDLDLNLDVRAINDEWVGTENYQKEYSYIAFRPLIPENQSLPFVVPGGFCKIQGQEIVETKKYEFRAHKLKEDEMMYLPNRCLSICTLILRKRVQDYNFKVTSEARAIIQKFIALRLKDKLK